MAIGLDTDDSEENLWIGLDEVPGENDIFEWTDSTSYDFYDWMAQTPNAEMECGAMHTVKQDGATWAKQLCDQNKKFVCKKTMSYL